jgi:hypothetical protein
MHQQPYIVAVAVLTAAIATAATVSAQTAPGAQAMPAMPELTAKLSEKPYSRLFEKQQLSDLERQLSQPAPALQLKMRPNSARRFICGMPVLPADSSLDPGIARPLADTATRFTMRILPMLCR